MASNNYHGSSFDFRFRNNYMFSEAGIVPGPTSKAPLSRRPVPQVFDALPFQPTPQRSAMVLTPAFQPRDRRFL
jgi:hypothetical protein